MELALLVVRLLLAAVFLLAGVAKLGDRKGSSETLRDFGLPLRLAGPLSWLLSAAEIVVAVALVPIATAWYGACGALALFSIFVAGIGVTLARGLKPDCHCFGQLHSAPVGWPTLVRNGVLGAAAGWLVFRGPTRVGPGAWAHIASAGGDERRIFIVAGCVLCFLFFRALRRPEREEPAMFATESPATDAPAPEHVAEEPRNVIPFDGLPIGTPAPEFTIPSITGQQQSLESLRGAGKTVCLVFSSPHCASCQALMPTIGGWMREYEESFHMVVISRGTVKENLAKLKDFEVSRVLLQKAFEVSESYGVTATPAALLVGSDGLIQSQLVVGRDDIRHLISSSAKVRG